MSNGLKVTLSILGLFIFRWLMQKSEQINEIAKALAQAQSEMGAAKKDAKNPFFKSSYATLEAISDACLHLLNKNGIAVTQTTMHLSSSIDVSLCTTLMHSSGQWIQSVYPVHPTKNDPQSLGSALSYARRYSLAAIAGVTVSDDDGEAATQEYRQSANKSKETQGDSLRTQKTANSTAPSEAQILLLKGEIKKSNWSDADVITYLEQLGISKLSQLTWFQYESMIEKVKLIKKTAKVMA